MNDGRKERRGLGRGLSALMADVMAHPAAESDTPASTRADARLPIELLHPNPDQPRRSFPADALAELAESVRAKGVIQPLVVRRHPAIPGEYEIVAGERRWRAAQAAGLHEVPVVLRELSDTEVLEIAIIENVQRADLNPVEEASGYKMLMDRFGYTQDRLAAALSKSRSYIANAVRLLSLPDDVLVWLREGRLSAGHARALITSDDAVRLARDVISRGLSVRETERLATGAKRAKSRSQAVHPEKDADTRVLEQDLSAALGMRVAIAHKNDQGGSVIISYRTLDQLDQLCQVLSSVR
jgi:ParB family chromosome partitioning protein